jgi:hypothetical protein
MQPVRHTGNKGERDAEREAEQAKDEQYIRHTLRLPTANMFSSAAAMACSAP